MSIVSTEIFGARWVRPLRVEPGHWKKQLPASQLKLAVRGQLEEIAKILSRHPDLINKRGPRGRHLLWEAVRCGHADLVEYLLSRGADPNLTGCINSDSLVQLDTIVAAEYYDRKELIPLLVQHGGVSDVFRACFGGESGVVQDALVHDRRYWLGAEDPEDEIYFHPLLSFAISGLQIEIAKQLIDLGAAVSMYSFQMLFIAARRGSFEMLNTLVDAGARAECADSSLWMATENVDILRFLTRHGLDANQRPYSGLSPLVYACRADKHPNLDKVALLLELGADINFQDKNGQTALHNAASGGNAAMVEVLLDAGANLKLQNNRSQTAFDIAAQKNHLDVVRWLKT